jgi:hypothetical protein
VSDRPFAPASTQPHVFIVGTEDYVYRVLKGKLRAKGVAVTGHAPNHWQPPFAPPRGTTHLLIVEDDCPAPLRVHAQHLVHEIVGLDVVLAPARNRRGETEELLRRHGVLEPMEPRAAALETAPELRPTIGELIAAKVKVEEVVIEAEPVIEKIPEPEPPAPEPEIIPPPPSRPSHKVMVTRRALAIEILKAIEGRMTDGDLALLVGAQTGAVTTADEVATWRRESNSSGYRRGSKPARLLPIFARYGLTFVNASEAMKEFHATRRERKAAEVKEEKTPTREDIPVPTPSPYVARFTSSDPRYQYALQQIKKRPTVTNFALDREIKEKFGRAIGSGLHRVRVENGLPPSPGRPNGVVAKPLRSSSPQRPVSSKAPPLKKAPPIVVADSFADALRAALAQLTELVIGPHHVHLEIIWHDGAWKVPQAERVTVVAGEVEI